MYIQERGMAPRYPMDVVAHFTELQEAAELIIDKLLEEFNE